MDGSKGGWESNSCCCGLCTSSKDKDFSLYICQFTASPQTITHSNNIKTDTWCVCYWSFPSNFCAISETEQDWNLMNQMSPHNKGRPLCLWSLETQSRNQRCYFFSEKSLSNLKYNSLKALEISLNECRREVRDDYSPFSPEIMCPYRLSFLCST